MKKILLMAAAVAAFFPAFAQDEIDYLNTDYYMVGSNVNGNSWALAKEDAKFENKGDGVFEWSGDVLGTGFKVNNGTWDEGAPDLGAGGPLSLDTRYVLSQGGGNISFADIDGNTPSAINNPKVVLTVVGQEVSIVVTGEPFYGLDWFLAGEYNDWNVESKEYMFTLVEGSESDYTLKVTFEAPGKLKIGSRGWGKGFGGEGEGNDILTLGMGEDSATLVDDGHDFMSYFVGDYIVSWNPETAVISFEEDGAAVEEIAVASDAVYFNLQGMRVANPENGLFVKVVDGKATKVIVRK